MNRWLSTLLAAALCAPASARAQSQDSDFTVRPLGGGSLPAPKEESDIIVGEGADQAPESAAEAEPEAPAAAEPEPASEPEPAKEEQPAPKPATEPARPRPAAKTAPARVSESPIPADRLEGELQFLEANAENAGSDIIDSLYQQSYHLALRLRGTPSADRALMLKGRILEARKESLQALVEYAKLVYEHPESGQALAAKSRIIFIAEKKFRRSKQPFADLAEAAKPGASAGDALAALLRGLAGMAESDLDPLVIAETHEFLHRFPGHSAAGELTLAAARIHERLGEPMAAILLAERIPVLYTDKTLLADAQTAVGDFHSGKLKQYDKAVAAYQAVIERYPESGRALEAHVKMAALLGDKMRQPSLAIEVLDKIVAKYPKTDAAFDALTSKAEIYRSKLDSSGRAVETLEALAEMFGGDRAAEALWRAADVAGRAKDHALQIRLWERLAEEHADHAKAPEGLWEAGQAYEKRLDDASSAVKVYEKISERYAGTPWAAKAAKRVEKINAG